MTAVFFMSMKCPRHSALFVTSPTIQKKIKEFKEGNRNTKNFLYLA